jgi:hypothetical protein
MKLEFSLLGDGTNVQVALLEMLGETETVKDRFYTATHKFPLCLIPNSPQCEYEETFYDLEGVMEPPKIGGSLGHLHPYWHEREEVKRKRLQKLESNT